MSRINLLPESYVAHERRRRMITRTIVAAALVLIVCASWGSVAYMQVRALDLRMEVAEGRLAAERDRARALEKDRIAVTSLRAMLAHRAQLESPIPAPGVLSLLTQLLPESVAVTRLSMDLPPADLTDRSQPQGAQGNPALPPAVHVPTRIEMDGIALSDVELAKVVGTLASHKAFTNVKLVRSRQVTTEGVTRFAFQITLDVPAALPASGPAKASVRAAEKESRGA